MHVDAEKADDLGAVTPEKVVGDVRRPPAEDRVLELEPTAVRGQARRLEPCDTAELLVVETAGDFELAGW
jgi:hypothetical protein